LAGSIGDGGGPPPDDWEAHRRAMADARAHQKVLRRLGQGMQTPWMTRGLVVVMGVIHLVVGVIMVFSGSANIFGLFVANRPTGVLVNMGAMYAPAVSRGEVWRLISCVFLHGDGMHMLLNGLALYGLGRLCEGVYGSIRFLWLFLVCGVVGAVFSYVGGNTASVGASGGIFGLMGACIVFGWRYKRELPPHIGDLFRRKLLPWVVLNLFIGIALPFIDNLGHVGGLISGAVMATLLGNRIIAGQGGTDTTTILMGAASGLMLALAAMGVPLGWFL
jgi:rhomboid protease GluP